MQNKQIYNFQKLSCQGQDDRIWYITGAATKVNKGSTITAGGFRGRLALKVGAEWGGVGRCHVAPEQKGIQSDRLITRNRLHFHRPCVMDYFRTCSLFPFCAHYSNQKSCGDHTNCTNICSISILLCLHASHIPPVLSVILFRTRSHTQGTNTYASMPATACECS